MSKKRAIKVRGTGYLRSAMDGLRDHVGTRVADALLEQYKEPVVTVIEHVNHPSHYGDADNLYEAIKVIEAWDLGFHLGNAVKYISRAGKKGDQLEDLKKALWYLQREVDRCEKNS